MSFRSARQTLLARSDLQGDEFCAALALAADQWLAGLLDGATDGDTRGLALVAVGGYGRGELCPFSDLDVVLVHQGRRDVARLADAVWYPVWDEGVRLDHSVRRPHEVLEVARDDLRAQLGLLDSRLVAGDRSVFEPMAASALDQWRDRAGLFLPLLADQVEQRHAEHGDVAFLLEPDLKESHGGLRDVFVVSAAALAVPAIVELVDLAAMAGPRRTITAARVELQRLTGRSSDRLLLQEQDQVAAALGYGDADALMAAIAEAGRTIAWVGDDAWRRRYLWTPVRRHWWSRPAPADETLPDVLEAVEPGVAVLRAGGAVAGGGGGGGTGGLGAEVVLGEDADVAGDVTLALRLAAAAAEQVLPIGRAALARLSEQSPAPDDPWPPALRGSLVRVLCAGPPAIAALEALEQRRLLSRVLPEWGAVRNLPQRNAYHRFTVDRHLLEAAAGAAQLAGNVARPDLLVLGALLHDIGKGFEGDHTEVGIEVVGRIARRMGFDDRDVSVLVSMVRLHLLLPDVATRRDLDDPATVDRVARAVGDVETLELLAALTEADSLATGPAAWGGWKAGLVSDLVRRVAAHLAGEALPGAHFAGTQVTEAQRALVDEARRLGRTVVSAEVPRVTVVAGDRPGLLAAVTGVFALLGLDVRSADVTAEEGFAVETFVVEPSRGRWPDWQQLAGEIDQALTGTLELGARLQEQARLYRRTRPVTAKPSSADVTIDDAASETATVVEVRAEDAVGLLHRVTQALFDSGLDVTAARVSTIGHEVVDAFYVREGVDGTKLADPQRISEVMDAVRRAIEA